MGGGCLGASEGMGGVPTHMHMHTHTCTHMYKIANGHQHGGIHV